MAYTYPEIYNKLSYEVATVIFMKKDGTIRIMLATRNINTAALEYGFKGGELGGRDNKCNINNGNVAVIDMLIGEPRIFHIDRLVSVEYHGVVGTKEELDKAVEKHLQFKKAYEDTQPMELTMEMLD